MACTKSESAAEESKQEIMEATYTALCKNGYAELSIQKIADEFDKGKSLIYYHYADKEELMLSFTEHMREELKHELESLKAQEPEDELEKLLDMLLAVEDERMWEFQKAFHEFRSQSRNDKQFQEKFQEIDSMIVQKISDILRRTGSEKPQKSAEMVLSMVEGSSNRKMATGNREDMLGTKEDIKKVISCSYLNTNQQT